MRIKLALALVLANVVLVTVGLPQPNDPCAGLPLCRLKGEKAPPNRRIAQLQSEAGEDETDDGAQIVSAVSVPNEAEEQSLARKPQINRQTLVRRPPTNAAPANEDEGQVDDSACAGLIFCVLSKDTPGSKTRRPAPRRTTAAPARVEAPHDFFSETLMSAVLKGLIEEAQLLIEEGSDVNAEDVHGNSVLHIAAQNGRTDIIDDLLLNGADVNKGNNHRNSALHLAAQNGWTDIAEKLLKHRYIKVNYADFHGNTALHLAAQNGQLGVTEFLIKAEANLDKKNTHKHVPLHLAAQNGHYVLTEMLAQAGANLDSKDLIGNTPLHTAYHNSQRRIADMLLSYGASPDAKNLSGLRPSELAG